MSITLWCATPSENPKRFSNPEALIWATPEKVLLPEYGFIFWELEVELPPEEQGRYKYTGCEMAPGQTWGYNPGFEGVGAYVFKAGNIRSRKRVLEKLSLQAMESGALHHLKEENRLLRLQLEEEKKRWKPIPPKEVTLKIAGVLTLAISFAMITMAIGIGVKNFYDPPPRGEVEVRHDF